MGRPSAENGWKRFAVSAPARGSTLRAAGVRRVCATGPGEGGVCATVPTSSPRRTLTLGETAIQRR